jgi:hypothetical protein
MIKDAGRAGNTVNEVFSRIAQIETFIKIDKDVAVVDQNRVELYLRVVIVSRCCIRDSRFQLMK